MPGGFIGNPMNLFTAFRTEEAEALVWDIFGASEKTGGCCFIAWHGSSSHTTVILQEALHTYQGFFKLIIGGAVGAAHIAITAIAEGAARNDGYLFLEEQFLGKFLVAHPRRRYTWEGVESSPRLAGGQSDEIEAIYKHTAAARIVGMHRLHICFTVTQCLQRRLLCGSTGTHNGILVDLEHRLKNVCRRRNIAHAPACHSVSLGESVQQNGAFAHTRHGSNTLVLGLVDKAAVHLVNCHDQIVLYGKPGDAFQLGFRHNSASGVIRVAH